MKNTLLVVAIVLLVAAGAYAADITSDLSLTWTPQAGDAIRSSDIRGDHTELEAWANASSDSTIDWSCLDSGAVNDHHLAAGAASANLYSTSDTMSNVIRMVSGVYRGSGTDSRPVMVTWLDSSASALGVGDTGTDSIDIYIQHLTIRALNSPYYFESDHAFMDTGIVANIVGDSDQLLLPVAGLPPLGGGYRSDGGWLPAWYNSGDSHWFVVNTHTNGSTVNGSPNEAGVMYYWVAEGYQR